MIFVCNVVYVYVCKNVRISLAAVGGRFHG